ncbi:MAG: hypothetical protein CYPHOPRED_005139 [Cyphobasidiales sp. Tagirdzhanova-0007]|nr:MAG: hypothetical protein CYPHOPRED_005139 [Cyphobasidiales sp. Tagirdzhanova-0007]
MSDVSLRSFPSAPTLFSTTACASTARARYGSTSRLYGPIGFAVKRDTSLKPLWPSEDLRREPRLQLRKSVPEMTPQQGHVSPSASNRNPSPRHPTQDEKKPPTPAHRRSKSPPGPKLESHPAQGKKPPPPTPDDRRERPPDNTATKKAPQSRPPSRSNASRQGTTTPLAPAPKLEQRPPHGKKTKTPSPQGKPPPPPQGTTTSPHPSPPQDTTHPHPPPPPPLSTPRRNKSPTKSKSSPPKPTYPPAQISTPPPPPPAEPNHPPPNTRKAPPSLPPPRGCNPGPLLPPSSGQKGPPPPPPIPDRKEITQGYYRDNEYPAWNIKQCLMREDNIRDFFWWPGGRAEPSDEYDAFGQRLYRKYYEARWYHKDEFPARAVDP